MSYLARKGKEEIVKGNEVSMVVVQQRGWRVVCNI
jgi:hypothetical protein